MLLLVRIYLVYCTNFRNVFHSAPPLPRLVLERSREKNLKKKMNEEGDCCISQERVKLHRGSNFYWRYQVYRNVTECKQPNTAVPYV